MRWSLRFNAQQLPRYQLFLRGCGIASVSVSFIPPPAAWSWSGCRCSWCCSQRRCRRERRARWAAVLTKGWLRGDHRTRLWEWWWFRNSSSRCTAGSRARDRGRVRSSSCAARTWRPRGERLRGDGKLECFWWLLWKVTNILRSELTLGIYLRGIGFATRVESVQVELPGRSSVLTSKRSICLKIVLRASPWKTSIFCLETVIAIFLNWFGLQSHYFLSGAVPGGNRILLAKWIDILIQ